MTKSLRSLHFKFWNLLALALPICFLLSIAARPSSTNSTHNDSNDYYYTITTHGDSIKTVEIEIRNPLKAASCVVYGSSEDKRWILGRVSSPGSYFFSAPRNIDTVFLYDHLYQIGFSGQKSNAK